MAEKYILFMTRDGQSPTMLEHGAQARLKTYRDGVVRGLLTAGYRQSPGFMGIVVMKKDETRIEIMLLTEQEWKDW